MKQTNYLVIAFACLLLFGLCKSRDAKLDSALAEDLKAKQMLQGIWVNEDEEDVAFRAKGDSIFYPDTTSQPVSFQVFGDTLVLHGANNVKYLIVKLKPHLFIFKNQNGETVRLTLSNDKADLMAFDTRRPQALNQNRLIKRDTVVTFESQRYHSYVQVNPTTFKVVKTSYNDEGVEVDNVYHDNIIHISIFKGAQKLFSRDFHKNDFQNKVPADFLNQSILSDMQLTYVDVAGLHYNTSICMPDNPRSYLIEVIISYTGKMTMQITSH